jgi:hydroxyacylglutathione hydrolase
VRVLTSRYLQTNATLFDDGLIVDSPYFPDELAELRGVRLFATHAHYDHLMGRLVLPDAPLTAGPTTVAQLRAEPDRPQRELAEEDARTYVRRERELRVADVEEEDELELIDATGHSGDGHALFHEDVLCPGDYLSDVEIPLISWAGSLERYLATLERLEPYVRRARLVVPGHGTPCGAETALRRLEADRAYLAGFPDAPLPAGRDTPRQREIHEANLPRASARP